MMNLLKNTNDMEINNLQLKELRKKLGITQCELAKIIGVDIKTVQNWESGRKIPKTKEGILRNLENDSRYVFGGQHVQNGDAVNGDKVVGSNNEQDVCNFVDDERLLLRQAMNEISEMRKLLSSALEANQRTNDRLLSLLEKCHGDNK